MAFQLKNNPVKAAIKEGRTAFGMYVAIPSPAIIEIAGIVGFDFVRLDWAHSPLDMMTIENMIRAAECHGIAPFVRLSYDEQNISSVLEMGAMGIIVPDVSTVETARAVVNAAKFSPVGGRGMFSAPRKSGYGMVDGAAFKKWTNEEVMVSIQIESMEAIENIEEILSVPGIDMVQSGRGDLSNALGVPGQKTHPVVLEAEQKIFKIAKSKGISISPQLEPTASHFAQDVKDWVKNGADMISFGHDIIIIRKAFENIVKTIGKNE